MEIFADELQGKFSVVANGGNGLRGKDGANGRPGVDNNTEVTNNHMCEVLVLCYYFPFGLSS